MGHYLINTTWRCQLHCPYCLLPHIKIDRAAPEHSWSEWAVALRDHTEPGSLLDFAGGDPLVYPGMALLLDALAKTGRRWALTTNALSTEGTEDLVRVRPANCALVNVSDHPGNGGDAARANIARLRQCFPVVFNRVDTEKAGHHHDGEITTMIPFQRWEQGTELDGIRRWCNSGTYHFVADPQGNAYRCNPHMATAQAPIGNLFARTVVRPEPWVCETGCSTCYTWQDGSWDVTMRPVE